MPTWYIFAGLVTYSLVKGLYKITTESIKFVLNIKQFSICNNFIIHTPDEADVQDLSFYFSSLHPC